MFLFLQPSVFNYKLGKQVFMGKFLMFQTLYDDYVLSDSYVNIM